MITQTWKQLRASLSAPPTVWTWKTAVYALILALGVIVFWPGLFAGFTSDAFLFLELAHSSNAQTLLQNFFPVAGEWYRPLNVLLFQVEYWVLGNEPLGYHLVALLAHVSSAWLIYVLAEKLTRVRSAALLASVAFLLSIHAQEVVYDVADLHNALGGLALVATMTLYAMGKRPLAWLLLLLNLLVDETGILTVLLLGLYEVAIATPRFTIGEIRLTAWRLMPFLVLGIGYLGMRLFGSSGTLHNETEVCHTWNCLGVGTREYLNRLFIRPEAWLSESWKYRRRFANNTGTVLGILVVLASPWRWRQWREIAFGAAWLVAAVFFFMFTLWPYVADRFLYIPDMGLALVIAGVSAEVKSHWQRTTLVERGAAIGVGVLLAAWIGVGAVMLNGRGKLWYRAGQEAQFILERITELVPEPPRDTTFVVKSVPDQYYEAIPPGNTGPYLFHNGLDAALRLRYGRNDIQILKGWQLDARVPVSNPIYLVITPGNVRRVERPTQDN